MKRFFFFCTVILLGLLVAALSQPMGANGSLIAAIDRLVEKESVAADESGLALFVRQPGRLLINRVYGLADVEHRTPITPRAMFEPRSGDEFFS